MAMRRAAIAMKGGSRPKRKVAPLSAEDRRVLAALRPTKAEKQVMRRLLELDGLTGPVQYFGGGVCPDTGMRLYPQSWHWCLTKNRRGQNVCRFSLFGFDKARKHVFIRQKDYRHESSGYWTIRPLNAEERKGFMDYCQSLPLDLVMRGVKTKRHLPVSTAQ